MIPALVPKTTFCCSKSSHCFQPRLSTTSTLTMRKTRVLCRHEGKFPEKERAGHKRNTNSPPEQLPNFKESQPRDQPVLWQVDLPGSCFYQFHLQLFVIHLWIMNAANSILAAKNTKLLRCKMLSTNLSPTPQVQIIPTASILTVLNKISTRRTLLSSNKIQHKVKWKLVTTKWFPVASGQEEQNQIKQPLSAPGEKCHQTLVVTSGP